MQAINQNKSQHIYVYANNSKHCMLCYLKDLKVIQFYYNISKWTEAQYID